MKNFEELENSIKENPKNTSVGICKKRVLWCYMHNYEKRRLDDTRTGCKYFFGNKL